MRKQVNASWSNQFYFDIKNLNCQIELDKKFVEKCNKNISKFDNYTTPTLFFYGSPNLQYCCFENLVPVGLIYKPLCNGKALECSVVPRDS